MSEQQLADITGLWAYTPEHDEIMQRKMEIIKNIWCGKDKTKFSTRGLPNDEVIGYENGTFWKGKFQYSVAVPDTIAISGWSEPMLSDGGYQHPITNHDITDIAQQVVGSNNFGMTWDNPRNGNSLRVGFTTPQLAEQFIIVINEKYSELLK